MFGLGWPEIIILAIIGIILFGFPPLPSCSPSGCHARRWL